MRYLLPAALPFLSGCQFYGVDSTADPIERGLLYVASAIITAAIIRAFFNH